MKIDLLGGDESPAMPYSVEQFEQDIQNIRPRFFDTYVLPGFLMVYAYKSKQMRKTARRILFTSGIYMMYRNYATYKAALASARNALSAMQSEPGATDE